MRTFLSLLLFLSPPAQGGMLFTYASSQFVTIGGTISALQNVPGATLMCWVRVNDFTNIHPFMQYSVNTPTLRRANINVQTTGIPVAQGRRLDTDSLSTVDASTFGTLTVGQVYHIAGVFNYAGGSLSIYVNGALSNTTSVSGWTGNSSNTVSGAAGIGTDTSFGTVVMSGSLSDCRVYNYAKSAGDIATIYYSFGRDNQIYGLVNRYKLDEMGAGQSGAAVLDDTGNNPGTATNTPTYTDRLF
jgi:Concanavalin A-like lectin/glucanases superfamily